MHWSLSEFLNLSELRSQSWCFVDMREAAALSVARNDGLYFYGILEGRASVTGLGKASVALGPEDVLMVVTGKAHQLQTAPGARPQPIRFLTEGQYADAPPSFDLGTGSRTTKVIAGRLKIRWPGGRPPADMPDHLRVAAAEELLNWSVLLRKARGSGASAILTRAATLLFVSAFRDHPRSRTAFAQFNSVDPVARARQYIETHPFTPWSVAILARKVGMSRSSFAMRFSSEVGRTPMDMLAQERMRHAGEFLLKTDMKVIEVAERVGYRSEAAFVRRFTHCMGMRPTAFRRRGLDDADAVPSPYDPSAFSGPRSREEAPRRRSNASPRPPRRRLAGPS